MNKCVMKENLQRVLDNCEEDIFEVDIWQIAQRNQERFIYKI